MTFLRIKWRYCYCLVPLLFSLTAFTQINITGKVVDENGNRPLPGASVYFNRTTIATYTNAQGNFYFEAVRLLNTELVISCAGYEVLVMDKPTAAQLEGKRFIFKLKAKEPSVTKKLTQTEAVRNRWLKVFYISVLGVTEEANKCMVLNEPTVYFSLEDSTTINALADSPLVIINKMLGYQISINLVAFEFNTTTGRNLFFGYTRYDTLISRQAEIINRKNCYYGSTLHFYRSLITHQLYQQGFNTFLLQPVKEAVTKKEQPNLIVNPFGVRSVAVPVTAQQILYIDSTNEFSIPIKGFLLVQYNKEPAAKKYLNELVIMQGYLPKGVESYINFEGTPIAINNAGVLGNPDNVSYSGFWMYEKIANLLPYNYQPE